MSKTEYTERERRIAAAMQEQLTLGQEAMMMWQAAHSGGETVLPYPKPHELTAFLMKRLKKTQAALRVAIDDLRSKPTHFDRCKVERLEKAL